MDRRIKVLIVDDEERFRQTTAKILEKNGFAVTAVGNGREAIEQVKKLDLDVVVLDVKMPEMDGNEALREIKNIKPGMAVIMLTGHGTPESAFEGLRDGVFEYLTKPCSIDLLALKIREAYENKNALADVEHRVRQIMIPLSSFSSITEDRTVAEAIEVIVESFNRVMTTDVVQETMHRSILVLDRDRNVVGIVTLSDLLHGLLPLYMRLLSEKPQMADSIYMESPNYTGMFTVMARDLGNKTVKEIMSDAPPVIDADDNLMEAVSRLLNLGLRRLLVVEKGKIVGVIREQDLFFEMANIIDSHKNGS